MGEEKIIESKNQNHRNKKRNVQEQFRVILGNKANESLEKIVYQVNDGFQCGTITKSNVVDWLLTKLNGSVSLAEVRVLWKRKNRKTQTRPVSRPVYLIIS